MQCQRVAHHTRAGATARPADPGGGAPKSQSAKVHVAYHPKKPGIVTECGSPSGRAGDTVAALILLVLGLFIDATVIGVVIGSFQGVYQGY
ncbi:hypothetical protein ACFW2Y_33810 [Streptomyces sp. NPDC058877]|uniref:hypothetical protein n=1 Tax=unclassified Streptomyces TaxID=2593676 RepID=UPI0036A8FBC2